MKKGLLSTLLAAAASVSGIPSVHANAPVVSSLPDIIVGDAENNNGFTDNNYFVYTNAFSLDQAASDDNVADADLLWHFAEGSIQGTGNNSTQWYTVNGKNPVISGTDAQAAAAVSAVPTTANNIRTNEFATFRDIVLSPGSGPLTSGFSPTMAQLAEHAQGRNVYFGVSDGVGVTTDVIVVKSIDNANDAKSASYVVIVDNQFPTGPEGWNVWEENHAQNGANKIYERADWANGALRAYVGSKPASGSGIAFGYRIVGYAEYGVNTGVPLATELKYTQVGANNWIRAKFHLFGLDANGGTNVTDTNKIPSFRLRVSGFNYAFASLLDLQHKATGDAGTDPIARGMAPGVGAANAKVYRVDMDPPETPQYVSDATKGFFRIFETYSKDTEPQENGYLGLSESQIGTYPAPQTFTTLKTYGATEMGNAVGAGSGRVNQTNAFVLSYPGLDILSYSQNGAAVGGFPATPTSEISFTPSASGFTASTVGVDAANVQKLAVATIDWVDGAAADSNQALRARVEAGKQYRVRFSLTSTVAASVQAQIRLRSSSVGFQYNPRLEAGGAVGGGPTAVQYLPGTGGWNNTWDLVYVTPFTVTNTLTALPGPGAAQASFYRDIKVGFDIIDEFINPLASKGHVTVTGITVQSTDLVAD